MVELGRLHRVALPTAPYDGTVTGRISRLSRCHRESRDGCGDKHPRRACSIAHVDPGDDVGWPSEATPTAAKAIPSGPVGLFGVPAARAALRGVARVHLQKSNSCPTGLVGEMLSQLVERPRGEGVPLVASKPYPVPDPVQLLGGDSPSGALRDGHDLLADLVVHMCGMALLSMSSAGQPADGRACVLPLQLGAFVGLPAPAARPVSRRRPRPSSPPAPLAARKGRRRLSHPRTRPSEAHCGPVRLIGMR